MYTSNIYIYIFESVLMELLGDNLCTNKLQIELWVLRTAINHYVQAAST